MMITVLQNKQWMDLIIRKYGLMRESPLSLLLKIQVLIEEEIETVVVTVVVMVIVVMVIAMEAAMEAATGLVVVTEMVIVMAVVLAVVLAVVMAVVMSIEVTIEIEGEEAMKEEDLDQDPMTNASNAMEQDIGKETAQREAEEDLEVETEEEIEEVLETMTEEKADASNVVRKAISKEIVHIMEEQEGEIEETEVEEVDQTLAQEASKTEEEAEAEEEEMTAAMVVEEEIMINIVEAEAHKVVAIEDIKSLMKALNSLDHQETKKMTMEVEALALKGHQAIKMKRKKTTKKMVPEKIIKTRTDLDILPEEVDHKVATEKTQKSRMVEMIKLMHQRTWIMVWIQSMLKELRMINLCKITNDQSVQLVNPLFI